jgi:hypothetical protein
MPPAGFEPATPASDWPQTLAFGIGSFDLRTVQLVANRCIDYDIPTHEKPAALIMSISSLGG